jgi:hypothetical protein
MFGCFNNTGKVAKQLSPKNSEQKVVKELTSSSSELPCITLQLLHPTQSTSLQTCNLLGPIQFD